MHESPSSPELLRAVLTFLTDVATPQLSGHAQFHARVSANALALVLRELESREGHDARAKSLYGALLGTEIGDLATLEADLCQAIRDGDIDVNSANLLESLREVAVGQLTIDQPSYSGLKT
jgi:Domain of unknown function (DUF6285)